MYLDFFGLSEPPFGLTPDTAFYFGNTSHQEALHTLLVALRMGEGFIKVTGEVGTGKTLLCRKLLRELAGDPSVETAYIPNPAMTASALYRALAEELGVRSGRHVGQHRLMRLIGDRLVAERAAGRSVVLIIDEAQALPRDCLEAVRLLTNLETEKSKLLQVVLTGQPELDLRLARPAMRQLRERISFSYALAPMDSQAVADYLMHRLDVAGYQGPRVFCPRVARTIARGCRGVPRLVNIVAHKCLLVAYGQGKATISTEHVRRAIADTESLRPRRPGFRPWQMALGFVCTLFASAAAVGAYLLIGSG